MADQPRIFRFGDLVLDCAKRRLLRANQDIYLPPKTFELLLYLIENQGRVVPKRELLDAVWPEVNVVENTLAQRIREIREALGDGNDGVALIKTIPRVGYQRVQLSDRIAVNVVECQSESGICRIVTNGHAPVPSPAGRTLYFMRTGKLGMQELYVSELQRDSERCLGEIGPFRLPDLFIDVSPRHLVAWSAFHEGKSEVWMTEIR
jgi:DNA-binding winged helix-turn-helix (wHTH) protein